MKCKVFLKNSDFVGGPYNGGNLAPTGGPSRNVSDDGSWERRPYPPKQVSQHHNQNRSPENLEMNWSGRSSRQHTRGDGGGGSVHRRTNPRAR